TRSVAHVAASDPGGHVDRARIADCVIEFLSQHTRTGTTLIWATKRHKKHKKEFLDEVAKDRCLSVDSTARFWFLPDSAQLLPAITRHGRVCLRLRLVRLPPHGERDPARV